MNLKAARPILAALTFATALRCSRPRRGRHRDHCARSGGHRERPDRTAHGAEPGPGALRRAGHRHQLGAFDAAGQVLKQGAGSSTSGQAR